MLMIGRCWASVSGRWVFFYFYSRICLRHAASFVRPLGRVLVVVAGSFLGFTSAGHRVLYSLAFARVAQTAAAKEMVMKAMLAFAVTAVIVAGFLGYTTPGHRLLHSLGLLTACSGSD
jgi:hypothetical protein